MLADSRHQVDVFGRGSVLKTEARHSRLQLSSAPTNQSHPPLVSRHRTNTPVIRASRCKILRLTRGKGSQLLFVCGFERSALYFLS